MEASRFAYSLELCLLSLSVFGEGRLSDLVTIAHG